MAVVICPLIFRISTNEANMYFLPKCQLLVPAGLNLDKISSGNGRAGLP